MANLTPRELAFKNQLFNQYKENKYSFIKKYGSEAENVMTGRAIKLAKKMAEKENQQKIKEAIRKALMSPIEEMEAEEEINSTEYIQNRKPVDYNFNSTIGLSIPLLIRMLEYAKEDAKTDMDLHFAVENMIQLAKTKESLNMDDYENIVSPYIKID